MNNEDIEKKISDMEKLDRNLHQIRFSKKCRCYNPSCPGNSWTNFFGNRYTIAFWMYYFSKKH
jgi:hypothetical protein